MEEFEEKYYRDPYCQEYTSTVVQCIQEKERYAIELEDTIFYPEGGGQPSDTGTLNGIEVTDVQRVDGKVMHYLSVPLEAGTRVEEHIDFAHRWDLMQAHTGEHIFSGCMHARFGYDNVGFHMGDTIQVDLNGPLTLEQAQELETEVNQCIQKDAQVKTWFPAPQELETLDYRSKKELKGKVRIVEIEGMDVCACCGLHVRHTGEVGLMKILSCRKHKNGVRLEMLFGQRAFLYFQKLYAMSASLSHTFSTPVLEVEEAVQKALAEKEDLVQRLKQVARKQFEDRLQHWTPSSLFFYEAEDAGREGLRLFGNEVLSSQKADTAFLVEKEAEDTYAFVCMSQEEDCRNLLEKLHTVLTLRGGGKKEMVQGTLFATMEEIRKGVEQL